MRSPSRWSEILALSRPGQNRWRAFSASPVQKRPRALKLRSERKAFTRILREFHSAADLEHTVSQLNGKEPAPKMLAPMAHVLEERRRLTLDLFQISPEYSFGARVDTIVSLWSLFEGAKARLVGDGTEFAGPSDEGFARIFDLRH